MIFDSGKPADPTTIEFILPDTQPSGFELPHAVTTRHKLATHAAARCPRRRSMLIATDTIARCRLTSRWLGQPAVGFSVLLTFSGGSVSFREGKGEDGTMSSDPSVSPDQPPVPPPVQP